MKTGKISQTKSNTKPATPSHEGSHKNPSDGPHILSGDGLGVGGGSIELDTAKKSVLTVDLRPKDIHNEEPQQARKTPQEILAEIRAATAAGVKLHEIPKARDGKTLNDLMVERKQRNEEIYCEQLRKEGKQIYTLEDVTKLGYAPDHSWTQKDFQSRMLYGPVLLPLKQLQKKADDHHQTFVIPGRKAVMEMMDEVYRLFLLAMVPERSAEVFKTIRSQVEKRLRKKLTEDASFGSIFIRFVFTEFDDRKVHLYSRALEFAYSSNVSADAFRGWVEGLGGWEKVRQEAAKAFNNSPDVLIARNAKKTDEREAESLVERWRILRGVVDTVSVNGKLSRRLGSQPGRFLLEVTWLPQHQPTVDVYSGHLEVIDILPSKETVTNAVNDMRLEEALLERDELRALVERLDAEGFDALDEETKVRYRRLEEVSGRIFARDEATVAAAAAKMAADATLESFV
jgi:hypothetical protein